MPHDQDDSAEPDQARRAEKRLRKLEQALDTRTLDPWERYRALGDLHDSYFELVEFADRKARFALVVMGALNALNFIAVAQPRLVSEAVGAIRPWMSVYVSVYAALSLYFFIHAIQTLRPRVELFPTHSGVAGAHGVGLRFIPDIIQASADEYYDRWTGAQVGQINRELALHVQELARLAHMKFLELDRVYKGLLALTLATAVMVTTLAYQSLVR